MFWNDWFKKKDEIDVLEINNELFKKLTMDVALLMVDSQIINEPALQFFYNDIGILKSIVENHITDDKFLNIKKSNGDTYLFVCGMHALGAGIYVTLMQRHFGKGVSEFTFVEKSKIMGDFAEVDAYELALKKLGLPTNGGNKKVLDHIILVTSACAKKEMKKRVYLQSSLYTYMQVLYNAGITIAMKYM